MNFVFEELERVGPLIAHVDQSPIGRQSFGAAQPKPTFTRLSSAAVGQRFVLGNFNAVVQDLAHQPQNFPALGIDGQTVVAKIAPRENWPQTCSP